MSRRHCSTEAGNGRGAVAIAEGKYPVVVTALDSGEEWKVPTREKMLELVPKFEEICLTQTLRVEKLRERRRR